MTKKDTKLPKRANKLDVLRFLWRENLFMHPGCNWKECKGSTTPDELVRLGYVYKKPGKRSGCEPV